MWLYLLATLFVFSLLIWATDRTCQSFNNHHNVDAAKNHSCLKRTQSYNVNAVKNAGENNGRSLVKLMNVITAKHEPTARHSNKCMCTGCQVPDLPSREYYGKYTLTSSEYQRRHTVTPRKYVVGSHKVTSKAYNNVVTSRIYKDTHKVTSSKNCGLPGCKIQEEHCHRRNKQPNSAGNSSNTDNSHHKPRNYLTSYIEGNRNMNNFSTHLKHNLRNHQECQTSTPHKQTSSSIKPQPLSSKCSRTPGKFTKKSATACLLRAIQDVFASFFTQAVTVDTRFSSQRLLWAAWWFGAFIFISVWAGLYIYILNFY